MAYATDPSKTVIPDQEQILLEPYEYILQIPGKNVRTKLATAFNHWLHVPKEKLEIISEVTQMLHNASLLIDDIEDNSKLRRGIPVAHNIYGVAHTINSANYVYFLGLEKVLTLNKPEAMAVFTEQLLELHQGQGLDIYWRDAYVCPSEEEYKSMVIKKTGGLFGLAVRLMQLFSENKSNFKPLLDNLGLYFQIRDDFANLYSKEYEANKSYCEDLTEGKFSFPLIHGIRINPRDNQIMSILRQRTTDNDVKKYCVEYLHRVGSFDYTRKVILDLEQLLLEQIKSYGGNPYLESLISELSKLYRNGDEQS
ncbi:geranylgeranyl pyrophosphate synthase-like [Lingula anatina]|uniref:Geranylgeranyl pyrophosphate synthase n=1 Tax=Lingula anatina TaxID=7574 RepID=A0A1S3HNM6_LINAN|nr:geranylgeranyl pyrophosphate synthase [Lingula anatina]XP_013387640.1 geranylgeranyl pyrophosphate synthase-like [Lingula anatina]|eukprot:XP_013384372.1 geranylgeranyl pyrophosphate synthase [Lingula anatina]